MIIRIISFLVFLLVPIHSIHACYAPPLKYYSSHNKLINNTPKIVLVKTLGQKVFKNSKVYRFEALEYLKGSGSKYFELLTDNYVFEYEDYNFDFNLHHDKIFWLRKKGRLGITSGCAILHPGFTKNENYLLFLDGPADTRGC